METALPHVVIYSDGACSNGRGGWASYLTCGHHWLIAYGNAADTTNNRMELTAMIRGLEKLNTRCNVDLYSDSMYVVDGVNRWIHKWYLDMWLNSKGKPVENQDLWEQVWDLLQEHNITVSWVKGHAGVLGNVIVDNLAQWARTLPV